MSVSEFRRTDQEAILALGVTLLCITGFPSKTLPSTSTEIRPPEVSFKNMPCTDTQLPIVMVRSIFGTLKIDHLLIDCIWLATIP